MKGRGGGIPFFWYFPLISRHGLRQGAELTLLRVLQKATSVKFSVPVLEVVLVASLFFAVPVASVVIDVACMMKSHAHQHLPLRRMIEIVSAPPQVDIVKREEAARLRREVYEAMKPVALPEFLTADPHAAPAAHAFDSEASEPESAER